MKKATYTIGAVIILILAAFSFVFTGSLGGCQSLKGQSFGSYDGTNIRYEQNSDFVNYISMYDEYFKSQGRTIQKQDQYYIFQMAFNSTVYQLATKKAVEKTNYIVPDEAVNRFIRAQFTQNGTFNAKEYNQTIDRNPSTIQTLIKNYKKDAIGNKFNEDNFGGAALGEENMFGLKTSNDEIAFLKEINKNLRDFNLASFKMSDYPDSEKVSYAKENIQKFMKFDLDSLTYSTKKEAETALNKINKGETTFADSVTESTKTYSNDAGKFRYSDFYLIEPIFKNSDDAKKLCDLKKDSVSEIYETSIGYTIFKANEDAKEPDLKDSAELKTISNYINQYDFARIQDYFTETAKSFAEVAKTKGFKAACTQFGVKQAELKEIALNYGNVSVLKQNETQEGLYGLQNNEEFLKQAFALSKNEISSPVIINSNVIVLQLTKEYENTTIPEDSSIKQTLVSYDANNVQESILTSPKLKNNFTQTYYKLFND